MPAPCGCRENGVGTAGITGITGTGVIGGGRNETRMGIVYSTTWGAMCPACNKPVKECVCRARKKAALPVQTGKVAVRFETAGRKGKGVTLITGLPLSEGDLEELAGRLKRQFGTGGGVKGYTIELQGDQREKAVAALRTAGYL